MPLGNPFWTSSRGKTQGREFTWGCEKATPAQKKCPQQQQQTHGGNQRASRVYSTAYVWYLGPGSSCRLRGKGALYLGEGIRGLFGRDRRVLCVSPARTSSDKGRGKTMKGFIDELLFVTAKLLLGPLSLSRPSLSFFLHPSPCLSLFLTLSLYPSLYVSCSYLALQG